MHITRRIKQQTTTVQREDICPWLNSNAHLADIDLLEKSCCVLLEKIYRIRAINFVRRHQFTISTIKKKWAQTLMPKSFGKPPNYELEVDENMGLCSWDKP